MEAVRRRLSYANVMATVAVFVALGGGAYAVKLGKGSVGPKQLKTGAVKTPKLADGSVTAPKLAGAAVTSGKIAPGSIGLGDTGPSLHQICPAGTTYLTGACIDEASSSAQTWVQARNACNARGGRLPTIAELELFRQRPAVTLSATEWSTEFTSYDPDDGTAGNLTNLAGTLNDAGAYNLAAISGSLPFRCVFNPVT